MSRCFPYLAIANRVRDESLIDSIKLRSHKRKAEKELTNEKKEKKQRKLEKRQRKLEKKEKREKKKTSKAQALLDGPLKAVDATQLADQTPSTKVVAQVESREGSGLTEEHEKPFKENLCYLSDGTQQSNKRPGEALSSEDSQEPNGKPFRVRLDADAENLCSTSGLVQDSCLSPIQNNETVSVADVKMSHLASTSTPKEEKLPEKISCVSTSSPKEAKLPQKICSATTPRLAKLMIPSTTTPKVAKLPERISSTITTKVAKLPEKISSTITPKVARLPENISVYTTPTVAKLPEKISGPTPPNVAKLPEKISRIADDCLYNNGKKHKQERVYKALFEDWFPIPLSLSSEQDDGDDWLLHKKQKQTQIKRTRTDTSDITSLYNGCRNSNLLAPKACYLPAADIYALPCTLPF